MKDANFGASIDLAVLEKVLKGDKRLPAIGVTAISLSSDQQLLRVQVEFNRTFSATDVDLDPSIEKIIDSARPNISGTISAYLGLTSDLSRGEEDNGLLKLKLLPIYDKVSVSKVTVAGSASGTPLVQAIVALLNRYADNVSGALASMPFTDIVVPPTLFGPRDLSRRFPPTTKNGAKIDVALSSRRVVSPMSLAAVAWVIDENRVAAFAYIAPSKDAAKGNSAAASTSLVAEPSMISKQISEAAKRHIVGLTGTQMPSGTSWLAISKSVISTSLSELFDQSRPCLSVAVQLPKDSFKNEIRFPDESTINCTPTRTCDFDDIDCAPTRDCTANRDCTAKHDTRNCKTRLGFNDPVCEGAKVLQNKLYDADKAKCEIRKAGEKLDCERIKSTQKAQCETSKAGKKLDCERIKTQDKGLCEVQKEALKRIARTGKFGQLSGSYEGHADVNLCIPSAHFSAALDSAQLELELSGTADIDAKIKFVPLDIVGHLACQAPWTESENLDASIPRQVLKVVPTIAFGESEPFQIRIRTSDIKLEAKLDPDPTELLLKSHNFQLSCSALAGALTIGAVAAKPFIKELQGQFKYTMKGDEFTLRPDLPTQMINGQEVKFAIQANGPSVILTAK